MKYLIPLFLSMISITTFSQSIKVADEKALTDFHFAALTQGKSYEWLTYLSNQIGGRMSGTVSAEKAVKWAEATMKNAGFDKVWLQPVMVPHWERGTKEVAYYTLNKKKIKVPIAALGNSIATPKSGIAAQIVEVKSIAEAEKLGTALKGKIVFFNVPMKTTNLRPFTSYGETAGIRVNSANVVGKFGASAIIIRSLTTSLDDFPHTGVMSYRDIPENEKIPAAAISTNAAELLSKHLKENPQLKFYFKQSCHNFEPKQSYNVIGELTGTENPNKFIVVGGHLDSWDLGQGSHDNGAGVVQSMEAIRLFKINNIQPRNTLRVVLFMDEENSGSGSRKYADEAKVNNEIHLAGLESDSGGFTPRGFSIDSNQKYFDLIQTWKPLFEKYGIYEFFKGGSGADTRHLKTDETLLVGYKPDSQRYFDYHHAATDTFDKVNKRELELGTAAMASLLYLMDSYLD
ncbi:MAG: M20/M25/M40 family metallo-hydrolase [Flavobacteriaceae bacterium]|nr:M20/M25/M40 family metallo-hydrolase [Flavobacteriaceae bacterium]